MNRARFLSLVALCCVVVFLLTSRTRADGELRVDESKVRVLLQKEPLELELPIDNRTGRQLTTTITIVLLATNDTVITTKSYDEVVQPGAVTLKETLPFYFSQLDESQRHNILWTRLSYSIAEKSAGSVLAHGVLSFSEIKNDLFSLKVVNSTEVREAGNYRATVQALQPFTNKPVRDVDIAGTLKLDDGVSELVLERTAKTDSQGVAQLEFEIPRRFPSVPPEMNESSGKLQVIGRLGAMAVEASDEVAVDHSIRTILTTDKRLYQPSQVVHLRAILFSPSKKAMSGVDAVFRVEDQDGLVVFQASAKSSRFGIVSADWPIADNARLGAYLIRVRLPEGNNDLFLASQTVWVSRYDLPNFTVTVDPNRKYFLPGENAEVKVSADYLFGQSVAKGKVRVVRESGRSWNYREQKWDIEEGESYEGETDAKGTFVAKINLAKDHKELKDRDYGRFDDINYTAYFTDPTTNRTEQRHFALRITQEPIHVYLIKPESNTDFNLHLPVQMYVSTFYADGSPAECKVNLTLSRDDVDENPEVRKQFRTNQYGIAKLPPVKFPRSWDAGSVDVKLEAVDGLNRKGTEEDKFDLDEQPLIVLATDKSLYRAGETIVVNIDAKLEDDWVLLDVVRDSRRLETKRLRLANGHAQLVLPYSREFKDTVWIAAYRLSEETNRFVAARAILFPANRELAIQVKPSQTTYRPGESARLDFRVGIKSNKALESALGVTIVDSAVEERTRTEDVIESGFYSYSSYSGNDDQFAGVTLNQLRNLDMNKVVTPAFDLLAEVLLMKSRDYNTHFTESDNFEEEQGRAFSSMIGARLSSLRDALKRQYEKDRTYPKDIESLNKILAAQGVSLDGIRDPWERKFDYGFGPEGKFDVLRIRCDGADRKPYTDDDFVVDTFVWEYFRPVQEVIDRALVEFHRRTGGFIRDFDTLEAEVFKKGISLRSLRDPWGEPYRFKFDVDRTQFVVRVQSNGPNRQEELRDPFRPSALTGPSDDFSLSDSRIDYFLELRSKMYTAITEHINKKLPFPTNEQELASAVASAGIGLDRQVDPWGTPYYTSFATQKLFGDAASMESRTNVGDRRVDSVKITPVTYTLLNLNLQSAGPDQRVGTRDDFSVATFATTETTEVSSDSKPKPTAAPAVFNGEVGVIRGKVIDPNGGSVPSATVTLQTDPERTAITDDSGQFEFTSVPPGIYSIKVNAPGFRVAVLNGVPVTAKEIFNAEITLDVGAVGEMVTVTSGAVDVLQTSASTVLPINGRRNKNMTVVTKSGSRADISTPRLREYFPETLLWQPELTTDKRGRAQLDFKLADNITTWKLSVIGSTENGDVGTAETEIRTFQPFFAELDPPRVLTQGDRISLPVVLRNYLSNAQTVNLELQPEDWFSSIDSNHKRVQIPAGDAKVQTFDLLTKSSISNGKQKVTAIGTEFSDAIEKTVKVHPDGEQKSQTSTELLDKSTSLKVALPGDTIAGSERVELKIYPNLMTHVWESVEAIMKRPYGCAEQTISASYPSLLVLKHSSQDQLDSSIAKRAKRYLETGYQGLIGFQRDDGAFGYWRGSNSNVALTAYAIRFLTEAKDNIAVDQDVIDAATEWLIKNQQTDGSWKESYTQKADARSIANLTALTARTIAKVDSSEAKDSLKRALDYLETASLRLDEPYLIASYALAAKEAGDSTRAEAAANRLADLSHLEGQGVYWNLETNTPFNGWGIAGRVEATALAIQALAKITPSSEQSRSLQQKGLLFLLHSKDEYGIWYSTQATVNVLDAMLSLLNTKSATDSGSSVELVADGRVVKTLELPANARLIAPVTTDITALVRNGQQEFELRRAGGPMASVQVVSEYYVPWTEARSERQARVLSGDSEALRLETSFDKTSAAVMQEITCRVKVERIGFRGYGMLLAEIGLPPGADVDRASLDAVMGTYEINGYEVMPEKLVLYVWPLAGGTEFSFKFKPRIAMTAKSESSVVYDYYNPEARAVVKPVVFTIK